MSRRAPLPRGIEGFPINGRRLGGAAVWETESMRHALTARDVAAVFRLLQSAGVSQRRIAAAVGTNQSEVSEILKGRRVRSVDVLERYADGLGVPRSWLGLAYSDAPAEVVAADVLSATKAMLAAALTLAALLGLPTMEGAS